MFGWDAALGLELLAVVFGFILWFKAAKAEAGPRKLAKIVAVVVIILAVLLAVCTVTRAFLYAGSGKAGMMGGMGYGWCKMHGAGHEEGKCPCCGAAYGKGHGPGMMGMGAGMMGGKACPWLPEETAASAEMPGTK